MSEDKTKPVTEDAKPLPTIPRESPAHAAMMAMAAAFHHIADSIPSLVGLHRHARAIEAQLEPPPPPPEPVVADGNAAEAASEVEIPDDWANQHHATRIALAKKLAPDKEITNASEADEVIEAEVARRRAAAGPQPDHS